MQRRATSKKREAEAKKEINMEDKEATPVEDVEMLLPPAEPKQPAQPEIQPEIPTQTGEVNVREEQLEKPTRTENVAIQEMLWQMMEKMDSTKGELGNKIEDTNKRIEENSKKMESDN